MSEDRLDDAIDRTVRQMMDADVQPGLRRRVLARLEEHTSLVTLPRLAAAAALLIVAVAIPLVMRAPMELTQQASRVAPPIADSRQPEMRVPDGPSHEPPQSSARTRPSAATHERWNVTPEEIPPFVSRVRVEPLASLSPIAVRSAEIRTLQSPEVIVTPLAPLEPVRVETLSFTPQ